MLLINCFVTLIIFATGSLLVVRNNQWAVKLQQYYVTHAKKLYGSARLWEHPWIGILFRVMIIFVGVILMAVAYPLGFGQVQIRF